jgi:hypothetical protein
MKKQMQPGTPPNPVPAGLIDEPEILKRVPVSRRTWGNWKAKGIVPFIRIGRRCLYHWPSVEAALLRRQTGPVTGD